MTVSNVKRLSPVVSRPLLVGFGASLLLHALLFVAGPRIELPMLPDLTQLDVTLVRTAPDIPPSPTPAAPPAAPAPKKPPRPKPKPEPAEPQAGLTEAAPGDSVRPLEQPAPEPAPTPDEAQNNVDGTDGTTDLMPATPAPVAAGQAWPRAGRIRYIALMGEKQLPMGYATHQWQIAPDGRYQLSELLEPEVVAAIPWFRPGRKLRESTGQLTATGLRPDQFKEREEGRPGSVQADFDWTTSELRSGSGNTTLQADAQDVLSLLYQLGYPGFAARGEAAVTAGGALRSYRLEEVGNETVHLPLGEGWQARHVRAYFGSGRELMDVWLASDHFGLPILIRTIDPKGIVYYLVAKEVLVSRDIVTPGNRP